MRSAHEFTPQFSEETIVNPKKLEHGFRRISARIRSTLRQPKGDIPPGTPESLTRHPTGTAARL